MIKFYFRCFLMGYFLLLLSLHNLFAQTADVIIINGKIFTSDTSKLYVQALAIKGERIIACGNNKEISKLANDKTKIIDIQHNTVVPGFNDAHDHPAFNSIVGKTFNANPGLDWTGLPKAAVIDSVIMLLKDAKPNEWIHGFIGTSVFQDTSMRRVLDSLAPNNPVELQIWWGHGIVVNKKALEASGYNDYDKDPLGGWFVRNNSNKISSLQQNAQAVVWVALNEANKEDVIKGLQLYAQEQLPMGITSVQYMGTGFTQNLATVIFPKVNSPQRIRIMAWQGTTSAGRKTSEWSVDEKKITPLINTSGVKYVIDGTPGEGNSLRKQASLPPGEKNGRLNYPEDTMKQILKEALTTNRQLLMHITADSSFEVVMDLIQKTAKADAFRPKRIRIEHNCVGPVSDVQKTVLKDYNILMMHTPKYCQGSPLRSLWDKGIKVGISPDGTTNPFLDIMFCTSMQNDPKENLTIEQAVIAYTKNNAYAEFKEKEKGTLMPGMLADLTVLSQDIFTIPAQQLPATKSLLTMIGGKIVYEDGIKK